MRQKIAEWAMKKLAERLAKEAKAALEVDSRKLTYARLRSNMIDDWSEVVDNDHWDSLRST